MFEDAPPTRNKASGIILVAIYALCWKEPILMQYCIHIVEIVVSLSGYMRYRYCEQNCE